MKLISALRKYFSLNAAQRQFINKGIWACNKPAAEVLDFIRPLASFDTDLDQTRSQLLKTGCAGLILLFIALILAGNEVFSEETMNLLMPFTLALGLGSFLLRWFFGSYDLHNNLRHFILPVLESVSQDVAPGGRMIIKIDVRGKTCKSKMINQKHDNPGWFSYPKVSIWNYRDYWFSCRAKLVDGSNLFINVEDAVRERKRTYTSISGKVKTKTKIKIKHKIIASLAMKTKTYDLSNTDPLKNDCHRLKVKDKPQRKAVTMVNRAVSTDADTHLDPMFCLSLVGKILMTIPTAPAQGASHE
ncbi:MAG TPA: hypothetical protein PLM07_21065 [Candidatus Rifleibacterium sp.]|nr:hypothetical protein [Candidatus Rifleibacterium sp.]HPT48383.1 hypothetical protein [Candidatus Rifleibacterium sp.]